MENKKGQIIEGGLVIAILFFSVGLVLGGGLSKTKWQNEAVDNNAAHWEVDNRGNPSFVWNVTRKIETEKHEE